MSSSQSSTEYFTEKSKFQTAPNKYVENKNSKTNTLLTRKKKLGKNLLN